MKGNDKSKVILIIWFTCYLMTILLSDKFKYAVLGLAFLTPFVLKEDDSLIKTVTIILIGTVMNGEFMNNLFSKSGFTALDILVISSFIRIILNNKDVLKYIRYSLVDKLVLVFLGLNLLGFIHGLFKYGSYSIEFKHILIAVLIYYIVKKIYIKISIEQVLELIFNSIIIYSLILLLVITFLNPADINLIDYEGRLAINITLYIMAIPYAIYMILKKNMSIKSKIYYYLSLLLMIYFIYLNQNRTIIILTSISLVSIYLITYFDSEKNKYMNIAINYLSCIVLILGVIFISTYMEDLINPIIERFYDIISKTGTYSNYTVRMNTMKYYSTIIMKSLLGVGWGAPMMLFNSTGSITITNGSMDNFFVTIGYKAGLLTLLVFILIIISIYIHIIKYVVENRKQSKLLLVIFPALILGTSFMTSQIHHTMTTSAAIWIIMGYFSNINNQSI